MERNKIKIILSFVIFSVCFISAVLLLITNFVSRMLMLLAMSNMNYSTNVPIIVEPVLVGFSAICLIVSVFALVKGILFLRKY